MCNQTGIKFGERMLTSELIAGREVVEVGALDVNGSLRSYVESLAPGRYLGLDIELGPGVDEVVDAGELVARYGAESFDVLITTEMLEHVRDWPRIVSNLKRVVRPGGHLLLTTRSPGFPYHAHPYDFWRYTPDDMRQIFSDFEILTVESDTASPGVFLFARRPADFVDQTRPLPLVSIITGRRERSISDMTLRLFWLRRAVTERIPISGQQVRRIARRMWSMAIRVRNAAWRALPLSVRSSVKRYVLRRG